MCEIAIIKPRQHSVNEITRSSMDIYRSQRSSLGLLAAYDNGDEYEYEIFKSVEPNADDVKEWVNKNSYATRLFIHGRLATHGEVNERNAHPIEIDCPCCSVDYLMHNGVVYGHSKLRQQQQARGHEFATNVDSEVIAHSHESVPADFNNAEVGTYGHQPSWILFSDERIFIYSGQHKYHTTERATMCTRKRDIGPDVKETDGSYGQIIVSPEEA